jgi:hypothetical protein
VRRGRQQHRRGEIASDQSAREKIVVAGPRRQFVEVNPACGVARNASPRPALNSDSKRSTNAALRVEV